MNWKQVIFTAIITLLVTILSGVIVNWYTTRNIDVSKNENLVYNIRDIPRFKSDSLNISLFTIEVSNTGDLNSELVKVQIDFGRSAEIMDVTNTLERTREDLSPTLITLNRIAFIVPTLYSQDKFIVNVALKNLLGNPMIVVQSQSSIGKPMELKELKLDKDSEPIIGFSIITLTLLLLTPSLYISTRVFRKIIGYPTNLNNTAFLSIHNRQYELAEELLSIEIKKAGGSTNELANYALVKCLKGEDKEVYEALIRMAEFVSKSRHDHLVLTFNRLIIAAYIKDYDNVASEFTNAINSEKKEFIKYFQYSKVILELRRIDQTLDVRLKELENMFHV